MDGPQIRRFTPYAQTLASSFRIAFGVVQTLCEGLFSVQLERVSPVYLLHVQHVVRCEDGAGFEQLERLWRVRVSHDGKRVNLGNHWSG